jgi:hypothetical protein
MLVEAERHPGRSYEDRQSVVFTSYQVKRNEDGLPGLPDVYFSPVDQHETERTYCDVTDAFDAEGHRLLSP